MDREEIILSGQFRDFKAERHYSVNNATNEQVAAILVEISDFIEPFAYKFSGIDTAKIDSLVSSVGKGLPEAVKFLSSLKRDSLMPAAQNKATMMPITESYLLNQLFKKAGVAFKPPASNSIKPEVEKPGAQVVFVGNCKSWVAVKKLTANEKTQSWEVAGILSGINHTIINKAFDFMGMKGEVQAGGRKSIGNLASALQSLSNPNPYIICKTCEAFGFKPYASPEMLTKEYPDIKPPKVKGRKPKG